MDWCCQTGLNCRPLHYQWSALPLSYGSMPGWENRPKGPDRRADPCHKAPARASAGLARRPQKRPKSRRRPVAAFIRSIAGRSGSRFPRRARRAVTGSTENSRKPCCCRGREVGFMCPDRRLRARARHDMPPPMFGMAARWRTHSNGSTMTDDKDEREGRAGRWRKKLQRERLKQALRENLKRRKSQARGRNETTAAPSHDEARTTSRQRRKAGRIAGFGRAAGFATLLVT